MLFWFQIHPENSSRYEALEPEKMVYVAVPESWKVLVDRGVFCLQEFAEPPSALFKERLQSASCQELENTDSENLQKKQDKAVRNLMTTTETQKNTRILLRARGGPLIATWGTSQSGGPKKG